MIRPYFTFVLLGLLVVSCTTGQRTSFPYTGNDFIHYGETACAGPCEPFDIYIFRDGTVFYRGFEPTTKPARRLRVGNYILERDLDFFQNLSDRLNHEDFISLRTYYGVNDISECGSFGTDHPGVVIEKVENNERKIVLYNYGCRNFADEEKLTSLIRDLRELLRVELLLDANNALKAYK